MARKLLYLTAKRCTGQSEVGTTSTPVFICIKKSHTVITFPWGGRIRWAMCNNKIGSDHHRMRWEGFCRLLQLTAGGRGGGIRYNLQRVCDCLGK